MKRTELHEKLSALTAGFASNDMLPAMTHFWFDGEHVMTFNDRIAMRTPLKTSFKGAVPGDVFLRLLNASRAREIEFNVDANKGEETSTLIVSAGNTARFKLAMLPPSVFCFEMPQPNPKRAFSKTAREAAFDAIDLCMMSVTRETSIPDQLGVTIIPSDSGASFYATNPQTLSICDVKQQLPIAKRVILAEAFCKTALALRKSVKHFEIGEHALLQTDTITLYGRLPVSEHPMKFETLRSGLVTPDVRKKSVKIPNKLAYILDRAIVTSDTHNPMHVKIKDGTLRASSSIATASAFDVLSMEKHPDADVLVNPAHVKDGLARFDRIFFGQHVIMSAEDGVHFCIAGQQKKSEKQ